MNADRMIHRELKSPTSKKRKDEKDPTCNSGVFPRNIIVINLGIICLLLLLRAMGLGYLFFQFSSGCEMQDKKDTIEKNTFSPEVETQVSPYLPTAREKTCDIFHGQWSCCQKSCYYFSTEEKTWDESKKKCQQLGSNLTKIDDEKEQRFIQSKIKYSYWVGLHKKDDHPWLWQDGTNPSWKVNLQMSTSTPDAVCGRIKNKIIFNDVCTNEFYYICENELHL